MLNGNNESSIVVGMIVQTTGGKRLQVLGLPKKHGRRATSYRAFVLSSDELPRHWCKGDSFCDFTESDVLLVESATWRDDLLKRFDRSVWYATSVSRQLRDAGLKAPVVVTME